MDPKSFDQLMKQRHSVRYFQSKEIPEQTLKEIMAILYILHHGVTVKHGEFM